MKTFIITGIQMRNKGSQAMFLSLYYSLKANYKDCEVIGFAFKYDSPKQYTFRLLPFDDYTRFIFRYRLHKVPLLVPLLTYFAGRLRKSDKWSSKISEMENVLRRADAIFDASGYTLGSGWTKQGGRMLLQTIKIARRYNKKIFLMPQSFGPFDWGEEDDAGFLDEVGKELSYPTKIYAREQEGYDCLVALGLQNVELSTDLVIRERFFPEAKDVLAYQGSNRIEYPVPGSVGFIINENLFRVGDPSKVVDLYARILEKLIVNGEKVCVLNTSTADINLAEHVLGKIIDRSNVQVITGEYSSPELIAIIARFKFVVASRYHSVVFAYRTGVPAVILGWATKYTDLAALFQQQDYVFDIREAGVDRIIEQIDRMGANYENESRRIRHCLKDIQSTSVVEQAIGALQG